LHQLRFRICPAELGIDQVEAGANKRSGELGIDAIEWRPVQSGPSSCKTLGMGIFSNLGAVGRGHAVVSVPGNR